MKRIYDSSFIEDETCLFFQGNFNYLWYTPWSEVKKLNLVTLRTAVKNYYHLECDSQSAPKQLTTNWIPLPTYKNSNNILTVIYATEKGNAYSQIFHVLIRISIGLESMRWRCIAIRFEIDGYSGYGMKPSGAAMQ